MQKSKTIWDDYAKAYDKLIPQTSFHQQLVERSLRFMKGKKIVLDAGMGTGILTTRLAEQGKIVYGVDSNLSMLQAAEPKVKQVRKGKMLLSQQDLHELYFEDNWFDGIVSLNVLYYMQRPIQFLQEMHRVLKPKGKIVLSGPLPTADPTVLNSQAHEDYIKAGIYESNRTEIATIEHCNNEIARQGFRNLYTAAELVSLLQTMRFSVLYKTERVYLGQGYLVVGQK